MMREMTRTFDIRRHGVASLDVITDLGYTMRISAWFKNLKMGGQPLSRIVLLKFCKKSLVYTNFSFRFAPNFDFKSVSAIFHNDSLYTEEHYFHLNTFNILLQVGR